MELIKKNDATEGKNSDKCKYIEYAFSDKDLDLSISEITGKYPEEGYCVNTGCKELIYVLEGNGKIYFENEEISFSEGDSILIDKNEKYYWDSEYCKISMTCNPAWSPEQHKLIK